MRTGTAGTWQKRMFLLLSIPSATSAMAVFMYDFIGEAGAVSLVDINRVKHC